jgi:ABC-type branched-subunit amino acid transport system ATPase component
MALARTLVRRPRLLVLDDFMLGLESREKTRILERIAEASAGMTVVLSSNDKQVMQWCHRTIVLQDGQLVGEGNYEEISQSEDFAGWMGRKGLKD